MRILFDLQALQNESRIRGIGRYVRSLFDALSRRDDIKLFALFNGAIGDTLDPAREYAAARIGADRVLVFPGLSKTQECYPDNKMRRRLCQVFYEAFVDQFQFDVLLFGSVVEGLKDDTCLSLLAPKAKYLKAAVLYDLIPLTAPETYLTSTMTADWYKDRMRQLNAADLLLAISGHSASEARDFLKKDGSQIAVISSAVDSTFFTQAPPASAQWLASLGITKPFVMHTSVFDKRKNFEGLVRAFARLPKKVRNAHQLLLVGSDPFGLERDLRKIASDAGIPQSDIVFPGHIGDSDLVDLYRSARLFVFPSLHEGFGLPALEAMSCGCPTIGSNTTSIPEVIGETAFTFDPANSVALSELIEHLLTNERAWRQAKMHAVDQSRSFSWDAVAERTIEALRSGLGKRQLETVGVYPSAQRMAAHVADRLDMTEFPASDVQALAMALAVAEEELIAKQAMAIAKGAKSWRVEGPPFDTNYSLALVNRETARAMAELGWQVALPNGEGGEDAPVNPNFLAANPDLVELHARASKGGKQTDFAVSRLNYPPKVADMKATVKALHHYAWEETGYPHAWVDDFNRHLTMMTTLATHIEKIMIDNGVSVPMVTSGCGVDHWERIKPDPSYRIEARSFRFLHVSSCFPRKGVDALLAAYGEAFSIDDDVSLVIKTFDNPHNDVRKQLADLQAKNPRYPHVITVFGDISDRELKSLYGQCHVMVGPSFAEGYGLPFAEAMLTGIPVITTNWGGQLDFCNPGNSWLVDYKFERSGSHLGVWSSAWARVDVPSLAHAMRDAYHASAEHRAMMAELGRKQLFARHKWSDVARRLSAAAATLPAKVQHDPRIGWISTWNSKCGIATYSQHLIEAMPGEVTVLAPENEVTLLGLDASLRLWRQSKSVSNLGRILAHEKSNEIDAFVIQFNYGFFNHQDLSNFIKQAKDRGKAVIICLHATHLPWDLVPRENYQLQYIADALSLCDRILVHSVDDLNRLKNIGLVENVALFPHGVLRRSDTIAARKSGDAHTIATYGFALPHKGLQEMIEAVRLMHERGRKVRLKMVNAQYPIDASAELLEAIKRQIANYGLSNFVEMHVSFLPDTESLALLTDSDLIVFPYQQTSESASGAVRYGMAVERPVAVTPLPIFNDLDGATFRMPGTSPSDLARGISATLDAIAAGASEVSAIAAKADNWREQHDYQMVGRRLFNICKALANR